MATAYHSASHGDVISKHWDQAVPLPDEDLSFQPQSMFENNPYPFSGTNYRAENTPPDYANLRDSSRALKSQRSGTMNTFVYNEQTSKDSSRSRSQSQSQSQSRARGPSVPAARASASGRDRSVDPAPNGDNQDDSAWIHRDKLAQIESREMAQAGIRVRRSSRPREAGYGARSASRSVSRTGDKAEMRNQSRDRLHSQNPTSGDAPTNMLPPFQDRAQDARQPRAYQTENDSPTDDDTLDYDPAMLQFVTNDKPQQSHSRSTTRPITSRIPVARASPAPLSSAVVERDSPMACNRAGSTAFDGGAGENGSFQQHRARSQSLGSRTVLDNVVGSRTSTTPRSRPVSSHMTSPRTSYAAKDSPSTSPKKKAATAATKSTSMNGRKGSTAKAGSARSRTTSAVRKTSPGSQPGSASKRPAGDAPWIATMYKPDPRLPQDQQILPTHAKRMMQEQSEKNGKDGSAYDRDFSLLDDNDLEKMGAFPSPSAQNEQAEPGAEETASIRKSASNHEAPWPLSPINSESRQSRAENTASRQSARSGGGYKITPTIPLPSPSPIPSSRPGTGQQAGGALKPAVTRIPDPEVNEKDGGKKDKSCGCCIVM